MLLLLWFENTWVEFNAPVVDYVTNNRRKILWFLFFKFIKEWKVPPVFYLFSQQAFPDGAQEMIWLLKEVYRIKKSSLVKHANEANSGSVLEVSPR